MSTQSLEMIRPYLSLLTNPHIEVRREACHIMIGTHGEQALTHLRRLLDHPDPRVGQQARTALEAVATLTDMHVEVQSFQNMYIECMGELRVYIGNHLVRPHDWAQAEGGRAGAQKVQSVLAYLVHCGRRGTSRATLGEAIWGGNAASLSRTLTSLRQMLAQVGGADFAEQVLTVTRQHCMLNPEYYQTDVQRFERLFGLAEHEEERHELAAAVPLYRQVVALYGGNYLANIPRGSGWSQPVRDLLTSKYLIAVERLIEYSYTTHRYQHCILLCQQALDIDPTAEDITIWMLRVYTRLDEVADLEHAYQRYLRSVKVDLHSSVGRQDPVVQAYQHIGRARAVHSAHDEHYSAPH